MGIYEQADRSWSQAKAAIKGEDLCAVCRNLGRTTCLVQKEQVEKAITLKLKESDGQDNLKFECDILNIKWLREKYIETLPTFEINPKEKIILCLHFSSLSVEDIVFASKYEIILSYEQKQLIDEIAKKLQQCCDTDDDYSNSMSVKDKLDFCKEQKDIYKQYNNGESYYFDLYDIASRKATSYLKTYYGNSIARNILNFIKDSILPYTKGYGNKRHSEQNLKELISKIKEHPEYQTFKIAVELSSSDIIISSITVNIDKLQGLSLSEKIEKLKMIAKEVFGIEVDITLL